MLDFIRIQNLASIRDITIDFDDALCMFSGESGVGKSTIFDAISLLFGVKNIRYSVPKDKCIDITGGIDVNDDLMIRIKDLFSNSNLSNILNDIEEAKFLILSRNINSDNRSRFSINGCNISMTQIRELANILVEICSQNSHHEILDYKKHVDILDNYCSIDKDEISRAWNELRKSKKIFREMESKINEKRKNKEYYAEMIREISHVESDLLKEEELLIERKKLLSYYKERENMVGIAKLLYEDEISLVNIANTVSKIMSANTPNEIANRFTAIKLEFDDFISYMKGAMNFEESVGYKIEVIDEKISNIKRIARKYGVNSNQLYTLLRDAESNLKYIEEDNIALSAAKDDVNRNEEKFIALSESISILRRSGAISFVKEVNDCINDLNLGRIEIVVQIDSLNIEQGTEKGLDKVSFFVTRAKNNENSKFNSDSDRTYSIETVSGGELSRLILAIKSAASKNKSGKIMIFDEVDIGIGGAIASKVGQKLRSISTARVFVITHQPQVASYANQHFLVTKRNNESEVKLLDEVGRYMEIARMLAGEDVSTEAIAAAKVMLREANQ